MTTKAKPRPSEGTSVINSPVGPLFLRTTSKGIRRLDFLRDAIDRQSKERASGEDADSDFAAEVERQVTQYFDGTRRDFDLPLDLTGTEFQLSVWRAIANVPFGETLTYSQIAAAVGRPTSYRAAGNACGANPVVIIVPCHRIVGTDRGLHGFGGGLDTKTFLLGHEGSLGAIRDRRTQPALITA
ncbi:MAG TPA: methylated-DNA--[protein]-cysteine S-methyltransferase [Dehalococcoidia bacterium]|nr:methylated-DNA--[protein]-cysteine S-methyltransferase [Dehalococcoidia bacterium]